MWQVTVFGNQFPDLGRQGEIFRCPPSGRVHETWVSRLCLPAARRSSARCPYYQDISQVALVTKPTRLERVADLSHGPRAVQGKTRPQPLSSIPPSDC